MEELVSGVRRERMRQEARGKEALMLMGRPQQGGGVRDEPGKTRAVSKAVEWEGRESPGGGHPTKAKRDGSHSSLDRVKTS